MNIISWITAVFIVYPHEWMHYIAARAFGFKAKIKINHKKGQAYVDVRGSMTGFQTAIIAAAPIIGTVIVIFLVARLLNWGSFPVRIKSIGAFSPCCFWGRVTSIL